MPVSDRHIRRRKRGDLAELLGLREGRKGRTVLAEQCQHDPPVLGVDPGVPILRIRGRQTANEDERRQNPGDGCERQSNNAPAGLAQHRQATHGLPH